MGSVIGPNGVSITGIHKRSLIPRRFVSALVGSLAAEGVTQRSEVAPFREEAAYTVVVAKDGAAVP